MAAQQPTCPKERPTTVAAQTFDDELKLFQVSTQVRTRSLLGKASVSRGCPARIWVTGVGEEMKDLTAAWGPYLKTIEDSPTAGYPIYKNENGYYLQYASTMHEFNDRDEKVPAWMITASAGADSQSRGAMRRLDPEVESMRVTYAMDEARSASCPEDIIGQKWWSYSDDFGWVEDPGHQVKLTHEKHWHERPPPPPPKRIYDLLDHTLKHNEVYHAVLKIAVGTSYMLLQMSPTAVITSSKEGQHHEEITDKIKTMFVADREVGFTASCAAGEVYESTSLRIKPDVTMRTLVDAWVETQKHPDTCREWSPGQYNCQHFAIEMLMELAADKDKMIRMLKTLTHSSEEMVISHGELAGKIARAVKGPIQKSGVFSTPFENLLKPPANKHIDVPIDSIRLYYEEVFSSYGTTDDESRTRDYLNRQTEMCKHIDSQRLENGYQDTKAGRLVATTSPEFYLRDTL